MKDRDISDWIVTAVIIVVAVLGLRSCSMSSGGGGGGGGVDYEEYDTGPDCFTGPRGMECW